MNYKGPRQDMPPAGGYEKVHYRRNLPVRGPSGIAIFALVGAISAFGFYKVGQSNAEKRELARERAWSRIYLVPAILAEQDRDAYRRNVAALEREKQIMKDVPGWEAGKSVYNTKHYVPSTVVVI
ncbi:hypothetical protein A1Q2_06976 [Trichosporon asahii var. asahii CBS 8904]|uniref:NADH dehydrogenase [ubiquinone] 1 alpha subcomplex subunit 13 n=2 Tax=Trichosporon asahii var. asahii TaxID=189963 RepID=K1V447_TRIAC|nr:hypothetical protein A1Q1_06311 [Trichosporon asahii var. asahii CBS 2479]EJT52205.1 hypothetical protein A1Q1_06311 [Trichosporon asahii var. asahii CBS 2479]EKC98744.1 hypothetical protein A1Q2_06976 [Trichosporon asahii var. asahii CBS 8904]